MPDHARDKALVFTGPVTYYYTSDHLGSPQMVTNTDGVVVWQGEYRPFGAIDLTLNDVANNIRFPGQYFDGETGLHYNWHRFYDPATGRYISADPIGLDGGINLYAYVGGDPVNAVDPKGLAVTNFYHLPILIKPEDGPPEWLEPYKVYEGCVDGVKPPAWNGDWYKVKGASKKGICFCTTDVTIYADGTPEKTGGSTRGWSESQDAGPSTDNNPGRKKEPLWSKRHPDWSAP